MKKEDEKFEFHNTYHFAPVGKDHPESVKIPPEDCPEFRNALGPRTFDRYHPNTKSGKLLCRLVTDSPTVLGGLRQPTESGLTRIHPFTSYGELAGGKVDGPLSVPGSSIRGCVSSVAETVSNSALRVLDNEAYSRRVDVDLDAKVHIDDYSAIGIVRRQGDRLVLQPLCLPTLRKTNGGYLVNSNYRKLFPDVNLKAYCEGMARSSALPTYDPNGSPIEYYAEITGSYSYDPKSGLVVGRNGKTVGKGDAILLGNRVNGTPSTTPGANRIPGFFRVIYLDSRKDELPPGKKHELFIPLPAKTTTVRIKESALNTFRRLARQRESENKRRLGAGLGREELLPFIPKGGRLPFSERNYQLDDGDIVFFRADSSHEVAELWISQLWRKEMEFSTHDFFRKVSPNLLPMSRSRDRATAAELLFGFVDELDEGNQSKSKKPRNFASRVYFGDATLVGSREKALVQEWIPLKILGSPKPPCPPFYFRSDKFDKKVTRQECYIAKPELSLKRHRPQGRKFYLHHSETFKDILSGAQTEDKEGARMKNEVQPLAKGATFHFQVDFENLLDSELDLLLFSLSPSRSHYHKIGMAKSLGFGSVQIHLDALLLTDRNLRYEPNGLETPRYPICWVDDGFSDQWFALLGGPEIEAIQDITRRSRQLAPSEIRDLVKRANDSLITQDGQKAIAALGKKYPNVRSPRGSQQASSESEGFSWFSNNARGDQPQGLIPLDRAGFKMPTLFDNDEPPKKKTS